jgi:hypothetical protein
MGPVQLGPVSNSTANYRLLLSSKRVSYMKKQVIFKQKEIKIWSWVPERCLIPRKTGQLTLSHKFNFNFIESEFGN